MSDKQHDGGFIDRWSARKRRVEHDMPETTVTDKSLDCDSAHDEVTLEHSDRDQASVSSETVNEHLPEGRESADLPLLTDDDMPPIESLSANSDLSDFFNKGVSAALRKAALRHVFQQPQFNVRDGLNDYDGDYTVFEPLGDTVTSDMKWHVARKERERLEAEALEEQERLALEEQALDKDEPESVESDEEELTDDTMLAEQPEEKEHPDVASHGEASVPDDGDLVSLGREVALNSVPGDEPLSERVAGKLRRSDTRQLSTKKETLQLAGSEQGNKGKAQDHEE